ncbi:MAG: putative membrane protein YfcA, partial [Hyphomicrobiaceae bacterium]
MIELFGVQIALDTRLVVLLIAVTVGGIVRGFTGFGSALIIIPALTLVFNPLHAVVMHSVMEVPVILSLAPTAIKHAERRVALPMILALLITTPIGAIVLSSIDVNSLKLMIAFAVLGMVCLLAIQRQISAMIGP